MIDLPGVALKPCPKCGADSFATNGKGDQNIVCSVCWTSRPEYRLAPATPASGPVEADDRLAVAVERLRADGWSVAVHNDYRLNGEAHTFWLWTHPNGRWIKGEGGTDEEALSQCLAALALLTKSGEDT